MILQENCLEFDFSDVINPRKFDDENHGLSHCMKAVDLIFEFENKIFFIEVKDPQNPKISKEKKVKELKRMQGVKFIQNELVPKYRDSFLYELFMNNIDKKKKLIYVAVIAHDCLQAPELSQITCILKNNLPIKHPKNKNWNPFIHDAIAMNIEQWNKHFPKIHLRRI